MKMMKLFFIATLFFMPLYADVQPNELNTKDDATWCTKQRLKTALVIGSMIVMGGASIYILKNYVMKPMPQEELDEALKDVVLECVRNDTFTIKQQRIHNLIVKGACPDTIFAKNKEPILIFLVRNKKKDMVEFWLKRGAQINILGKYHSTALDLALAQGDQSMVDLLKQYNAKTKQELRNQ